jgi:hypothetical protein
MQETITGNVPYSGKNDCALIFAVVMKKELPGRPEDEIPSDSECGNTLWSLLTSCWSYEPKDRPKADEVASIVSLSNKR